MGLIILVVFLFFATLFYSDSDSQDWNLCMSANVCKEAMIDLIEVYGHRAIRRSRRCSLGTFVPYI